MRLPIFQDPWILLSLLFLPLLIWDYLRKFRTRKASIRFPSLRILKKIPPTAALRFRHSLFVFRIMALSAFIVALARPQLGEEIVDVSTEGIDIVLVLDISGSMKTMDFKPKNRLVVAKQVIEKFIRGRTHDRIGLVVFSAKSFTQCPLTLDYSVLIDFLHQVDFGMVEDGTAIGTALLTGANRLRESEAKSKVIILLTDGENNAGEVDPLMAARVAEAIKVKVYTVGVGKNGDQPIEIDDPIFGKRVVSIPTHIDEKTLTKIAQMTGGTYNRAQDSEGLERIYEKIDKLEKTEIKSNRYTRYRELFPSLVWIGLGLIILEIGLANTRFMKIP